MKILIGGAPSKFFHLREFGEALQRSGADYKLVLEDEYVSGFPNRNPSKWFPNLNKFENLIESFKPDIVFCDRPIHFALQSIKKNIPLYLHLRGNYWEEMQMARDTMYKSLRRRFALRWKKKLAEKCFVNSKKILPISDYLAKIVKQRYPEKNVQVLRGGIDSSRWHSVLPMELKHPCVGLLQGAHIWGKTVEMLTLKKVLEKLSNVHFYWAGDGPYKNIILDSLGKFENFTWLGNLQYPDKVRQYLAGLDVYALISGMDHSPLTLQEASLMEKPVIATNAGGIPELMVDGQTGFLVEKGNSEDLEKKISQLINDLKKANEMGVTGKKFIVKNFNWNKIARDFVTILNMDDNN